MSALDRDRPIITMRLVFLILLSWLAGDASASLVLNASLPISHVVTVQPIIVSNNDGSNTAGYLGNALQTAAIQFDVDMIWSQAGIDVTWKMPNVWNNTFANFGNLPPDQVRPDTDLSLILSGGFGAGVASADPTVLNMYFVEVVPFFTQRSLLTANGLALLDGNGSALHIGDNLPGFFSGGEPLGQELAAKVIAHEIGHNLGLDHFNEPENMMLAMDGVPPINARLNAAQIALALTSPAAVVAVPELSSAWLLGLAGCVWFILRRRVRPLLASPNAWR